MSLEILRAVREANERAPERDADRDPFEPEYRERTDAGQGARGGLPASFRQNIVFSTGRLPPRRIMAKYPSPSLSKSQSRHGLESAAESRRRPSVACRSPGA